MFRDKRVRSTTLVMPMLTVLMLVFLFSFLENAIGKKGSIKIQVVSGAPQQLLDKLKDKGITVTEIPSEAAGIKLIQDGDPRLVLSVQPDPVNKGNYLTKVDFDPKQDSTSVAIPKVTDAVETLDGEAAKQVISSHGINPVTLTKYEFTQNPIQVGGKSGANAFIVSFVPYLIIIWAFYGGMSTATELVAGEKEKNTLETLLISPVTRTQIALGKYFSLATICLTCSCSSFVALVIAQSSGSGGKFFGTSLGLTPISAILMLLVLLPTVGFFAGLLIAVSSFAKNPREAQTYLAGISTLILMPAMFSQFIGYTDLGSKEWIYAIPVLNAAVNLRQILLAQFNPGGFAITLAISLALAVVGIRIAVHLFNREAVLARI